jgi:hypothetical protein
MKILCPIPLPLQMFSITFIVPFYSFSVHIESSNIIAQHKERIHSFAFEFINKDFGQLEKRFISFSFMCENLHSYIKVLDEAAISTSYTNIIIYFRICSSKCFIGSFLALFCVWGMKKKNRKFKSCQRQIFVLHKNVFK